MSKVLFLAFSSVGSREANAVQQAAMFNALQRVCDNATGVFLYPLTSLFSRKRVPVSIGSFIAIPVFFHRRLTMLMYRLMVLLLLRRGLYDCAFTRSPVFARIAIDKGLSTILELHAVPDLNSGDFRRVAYAWSHPNLCRIITISQTLADDLVGVYGAPRPSCDIVVAHDGALAGPRPGQATEHDGPLRVGYFGHLYPGKGMETIAALAPLLPDLRFEVYGGTEDDLTRWRAACASSDNLTLHGYIPHLEVAERMGECDILLAPYATQVSHFGRGDIGRWMSPLKLFEYMAAERPIVTADLPVLREVVRDGETALLCPPGDVLAYVDALKRLSADPTLRARLGSAGRDLLEAEYTWEKRARRVLKGIIPATAL